jgi:hypothetical protein
MSGGFSVPFGALAVFADNKYQQAIWAALALCALVFATYRIWKIEREKVLELQEKLSPIRIREIEAQEAHTAALREQSVLMKEQIEETRKLRELQEQANSPLHRVITAQQEEQIKAALNPEFRKQAWLNTLRKEYIASHDDISPGISAGTELPPAEWMNRRLAELNKPWRI